MASADAHPRTAGFPVAIYCGYSGRCRADYAEADEECIRLGITQWTKRIEIVLEKTKSQLVLFFPNSAVNLPAEFTSLLTAFMLRFAWYFIGTHVQQEQFCAVRTPSCSNSVVMPMRYYRESIKLVSGSKSSTSQRDFC